MSNEMNESLSIMYITITIINFKKKHISFSYSVFNNYKNVLNHNPKYWQIIAFYGSGINGAIDNAASCIWQGVISQTLHSSQTAVWKKLSFVVFSAFGFRVLVSILE